jgi:hypothetical protein
MPKSRLVNDKVRLERSEVKALLHWAAVGVNYSRSGGYKYVVDVIPAVAKQIGFKVQRASFIDFDMRVVSVEFVEVVNSLIDALNHMQVCAVCAQENWDKCEGGRAALEAIAKVEGK